MVQPALKSCQMPDLSQPQSLAQRIEAEIRLGARPEFTVTSMAERFAPDALRAPHHALRGSQDEPRRLPGDVALSGLTGEGLANQDLANQGLASDSRRFALTRGVVVVLTAVAIAPAMILAGLLWLAIRGPAAHFDPSGSRPAPVQQAAAATPLLSAVTPAPEIALSAPEAIAVKAGEAAPFAIAIAPKDAPPARSVIAIRDLPEGVTFSGGRPYDTSEWNLRPDEIAGLTLHTPDDQTGATDLRVELVAADGAVLARSSTRLDIAPVPHGLALRSGEADRVETLMDHGNKMIAVGYFAGARAYFERAAEAGSGEAALAVGATYDPDFIAALGVQGIKPEPAAAKDWYDRAEALGVTDRDMKLAGLKQDWSQSGGPPAAVDSAAVPEEAAPAPVENRHTPKDDDRPGPLGRLVAAASELTSTDEWVEVSSAVNMREGASGTADTLKIMPAGAKLRVAGRDGNWVQVADPATKQQGWIYRRFLKETEAP